MIVYVNNLLQGTHSVVRECKCKVTLQSHAVKIFRSEDEEMFIHAEREFKILSRLKGNSNIVQGIEYIPEFLRSRGYIVMEKVEGLQVSQLVSDKGPVTEEQAKIIMRQVISSVDYMHENGVVHRDLNPTNVFITDEKTSQIKILDFNVSKLIENQSSQKRPSRTTSFDQQDDIQEQLAAIQLSDSIQTSSQYGSPNKFGKFRYSLFTKTGTPIYTAPEIHQAFRYSENVDMWGVGTILYTLLMGEPPFYDTSIPKLMKKVQTANYDRSSPAWMNLSPLAQEFVMGLLQTDPNVRLTTKEALAHPWLCEDQNHTQISTSIKPFNTTHNNQLITSDNQSEQMQQNMREPPERRETGLSSIQHIIMEESLKHDIARRNESSMNILQHPNISYADQTIEQQESSKQLDEMLNSQQ
eukprot:403339989